MTESAVVCLLAVLVDHLAGEPRRWHPIIGFGNLAMRTERWLNQPPGSVLNGVAGVLLLTVPAILIAVLASLWLSGPLAWGVEAVVIWLAMSLRGLAEHGRSVAELLAQGDIDLARTAVARIVSRDATALDENGIATAATESMLENGADAVFASLFWFVIAGLPGVVLHRLVNTLDAMWGYRNSRYLYFGRFAAQLDDVMNWMPARLTAATYALIGKTRLAVDCWRHQSSQWESPNAGPVMAAGAGALGVSLGGVAPYSGGLRERPSLGAGSPATAASVKASIHLVYRGVALWLLVLTILSLVTWL